MSTAETGYAPGEYDTEALPVRPRQRLSLLTAILALSVVAAAAFIGGVEIQKHDGGSSSASAGQGGSGQLAALRSGRGRSRAGPFGGGAFAGAGAFGGGNATAGLVTLIKGSTLYVTDFSGNTVKVTISPGLQVSKTVATSLKGIHPGDSVVVRGAKQKDGSYKASAVTIGGAGNGG